MEKIKKNIGQMSLHTFFILLCLCYIIPIVLVISISFEGQSGQFFSLFPKEFSLT